MWRLLGKPGAGGNSFSLKQKKQTQNLQQWPWEQSWVVLTRLHTCHGENGRLLVAVTLSLSGAVTSEVQNLGLAIYCGKGKEEKYLTSIRLGQVQYINDNKTLLYLISCKRHSCPCPHNILLAV